MSVRLGLFLALMLPLTWSCSGDEDQKPKEPVAAEQKVPDQPGMPAAPSGESEAAKPAGEGQAAAEAAPAAAAAAAEPEKSVAPTEAMPAASSQGDMVVKSGALNVRQSPGTKSPVVRQLKRGEHVAPVSCEKGWCKLAEGEYVSKKFLAKPE